MSNGGSAVIKDCDFSSNVAAEAGAIGSSTGSYLYIENTLFYNNTAHREASASGGGGAIVNGSAEAYVVNSTFFSNYTTWEGGAIANDGTMTVTNSTFSHNTSPLGGTIANSSVLLLRNSIVADSMIGNNCEGLAPITDGGGNLRWPASDSSCVGSYGDPRLLPLEQNGGPTLTMSIQLGSAALRLATANCPATDQRGMPRGANPGRCDAGAYEWQGQLLFLPTLYRILAP